MGTIDWDAVEQMCAANHLLYAAAYDGNEGQLDSAITNGADAVRVAQWIEDDNAREFLLNRVVTSHTPPADFHSVLTHKLRQEGCVRHNVSCADNNIYNCTR